MQEELGHLVDAIEKNFFIILHKFLHENCSFCKGFQVNLFKKDFLSLGCSCSKSQAG